MKFPFEVSFEEMEADLETYVSAVFSCLASDFMVMPKGKGFIEYPAFEEGYEVLKKATEGFNDLRPETVLDAVAQAPIGVIVIRAILGFTPPEWAYIATQRTGVEITQGFVRSLDRAIRLDPFNCRLTAPAVRSKLLALVTCACALINEGAGPDQQGRLHRLDKADSKTGPEGLRRLAGMGAPYAMLLYERLLGRPFAGHRDSVSELVGDALESAVEDVLSAGGISYRKTRRAESIPDFDQSPDFIIPSEFNPSRRHRGQDD